MSTPFPFLPDHSQLNEVRYHKVAAMRAAGIDPYPAEFEATHLSAAILADPDAFVDKPGVTVAVMGRVLNIRSFGKAAFFHLRDREGDIQVYINKKVLSEEDFNLFKEFLDNGDIAAVTGPVFRTKTGEVSVEARTLVLAAKSTRPLPEKWKGLTDKEARYRQRYVDLIVNRDVVETFRKRSKVVASLRRWLDEQDFLEVETPMMQPLYGGASARPFSTHHNALDMELYLRIAPELYLKRLVVGGLHRVYEINRNFRNEGISTQHNPEFTMLELYATGWNASIMMDFVETMLSSAVRLATGSSVITLVDGTEFDLAQRWERITILDAVERHLGLKLHWGMSTAEVRAAAGEHFIPAEAQSGVDAILFLFEENVEEHLVRPVFVCEFPKAVSPLAKSKSNDPEVADRFELYLNRMELANGFSELNDPAEQHARFAEQVARKAKGDAEAVGHIDEDYVRALEYGMPPTAGLGVGIDRLVMAVTRSASIRDVILFPLMKPQAHGAAGDDAGEDTPQ
jgi:lysyl-tRNA synthetase class 2